MKSFRAADFND